MPAALRSAWQGTVAVAVAVAVAGHEDFGRGGCVAALVYFRKVAETGRLVTYLFGEDPECLGRRLTVDKESRTSTVQDARVDHTFLKASQKLKVLYAERGAWPERGMSAS